MTTANLTGLVIALDERTARLHLRALDAMARELERVQPAQLGAVKLARADLVACLQESGATNAERATGATPQMQPARLPSQTVRRDRGVIEMLTAPEAARRFGVSATYVRRKAADWGGELIEGQWLIPSNRITTRRTP